VKRYVKNPILIDAFQWDGDLSALEEGEVSKHIASCGIQKGVPFGVIRTLEGDMKFYEGDYIVKGVVGEFYPVKKEIFEKTYREFGTIDPHICPICGKKQFSYDDVTDGGLILKDVDEDGNIIREC